MSVRLETEERDNTIPARDMRDGQIGVITLWSDNPKCSYVGRIVRMRTSDRADGRYLQDLTKPSDGWCNVDELGGTERVRVLPNGTRLVVEDNE